MGARPRCYSSPSLTTGNKYRRRKNESPRDGLKQQNIIMMLKNYPTRRRKNVSSSYIETGAVSGSRLAGNLHTVVNDGGERTSSPDDSQGARSQL